MFQSTAYFMASDRNGTLYIGVTSSLAQRVAQHRSGEIRGFTQTYCIHRRVWFERHSDVMAAIIREKQLKKWNRVWKLRPIKESNPNWADLGKLLEP